MSNQSYFFVFHGDLLGWTFEMSVIQILSNGGVSKNCTVFDIILNISKYELGAVAKNLVHSNLYIFIKRTCFLTLHYLPLECLDRVQNKNYTQRRVLLTSGFEKVVKEQWRVPISRSGDGTLSCYIDDPSKPISAVEITRICWRDRADFSPEEDMYHFFLIFGQVHLSLGSNRKLKRWSESIKHEIEYEQMFLNPFHFLLILTDIVDIDHYLKTVSKSIVRLKANLHRFCCDRL